MLSLSNDNKLDSQCSLICLGVSTRLLRPHLLEELLIHNSFVLLLLQLAVVVFIIVLVTSVLSKTDF